MAQIFGPGSNTVARLSLFGVLLAPGVLIWLVAVLDRSSWFTDVGQPLPQPVPFSHQHHVAGLGIDCRYCHWSVEIASSAGMPSTSTCINCHAQVWSESEMLAPVRESYRTGRPLRWRRVYDLPDYVYFDHSVHVQNGIGCSTCHGRVDQMPLTWKVVPLQMGWCLDCHRQPERFVRPRDAVFDMAWEPPADQAQAGPRLVQEYGIPAHLDDCYTCHR